VHQEWPLVGRDEELVAVVRALPSGDSSVVSGRGRGSGVVLVGAAGVGKTRLAREALSVTSARGAACRWVVGTVSARALPLGAFAHLLPPGAGAVASGPGLRQVSDWLQEEASRSGLVLGVDDAHLLDDSSAALLHQLALRRTVSLVVTVRSGEPAPDAVTALWKDGHLARFDVQPLPEQLTAALVEAVLDGPVESLTIRRLYQVSQGNALFLRQLVDGAVGTGRLRRLSGVWQWRGSAVTPPLAELVGARIAALSPRLRAVIEILAFGEPIGIPLLAELTDPTAIEEAEQAGLVDVTRSGHRTEARLAHPLYSEVVRATTTTVRARRLCGRLAAALAATGARRSGDLLRRAVLVLDGGTAPPGVDLFIRAARQALALYDVGLAERLARAALAHGAGYEASVVLGHALSWQDRPEEAEQVLATLVSDAATDAQRARAAIPRAANLFWTMGDADAGERAVGEALDAVTDHRWRAELRAMAMCFDLFRGRPLRVVAGGELVAAAAAAGRSLPWGAAVLAMALASTGRGDDALAVARSHLEVIDRHPDAFFHRVTLTFAEVLALRLAGWHALAEEAARRDLGLSMSATWAVHLEALFRMQTALAVGRPVTAARWGAEAAAGFAGHDPAGWRFLAVVSLTQALGMSGRAGQARDALADAEGAYRASHEFFAPDLLLARAWTAAAEGELTAARELARKGAAAAAGSGQHATEVVALHTAVCFGDRTASDRLAALTSLVDGVRAGAAAAHARALADDDGEGLDAASDRLEEIGAVLLAADAAAQAALAHHRRGGRSRAIAAAARAAKLAEVCENARTPALRQAAQPLPLTAREREIASLAALGLSNRQIAERLTVSVRTVEGHIYRSCIKLDVSSRDDLTALFTGGTRSRP
jgi:DNA-binding CsgD family transcriptional regulator/predicted DNA-binding protein (UPF0251 family)